MSDNREIVARRFGPAFERKCAIPTMKECAQWDCQKAKRCKHAAQERVDFCKDGSLDEVYASNGAHLEHMGNGDWFLIFYHEDGSASAFWFESKDLLRPNWETRPCP